MPGVKYSVDGGDGEGLDLRSLLRFAVRHWLWICGCSLLLGVGAFAASYLLPRTYQAEVLALPVKEQQGLSSLGSAVGGLGALASVAGLSLPGGDNPAEVAVVLLASRGFLEEFIQENDLLPRLFADEWDPQLKRWRRDGNKAAPTLQDGYLLMSRSMLRASIDKRSGAVSVRIRWRDSAEAAAWANLLVERVNRVTREAAIREAETSIRFLETELKQSQSVEIRQSIASLLEGQMNKRMLATTRPDYSLKVLDQARPSDSRRFVSPNRLILAGAGMLIGAFLGALLAFVRERPAFSDRAAG